MDIQEVMTVVVGELDTAPSGFARVRVLSHSDLERIAAYYGEIILRDDGNKALREPMTEYAVYHLGKVFFYEEEVNP